MPRRSVKDVALYMQSPVGRYGDTLFIQAYEISANLFIHAYSITVGKSTLPETQESLFGYGRIFKWNLLRLFSNLGD